MQDERTIGVKIDILVLAVNSLTDAVGRQTALIGDIQVPALPEREALMSVLAEFAGAIAERRAPLTDARAGIRVLGLLEAATRSADDGGIRIPVNVEAGS